MQIEWALFVILAAILVGGPYVLWNDSKSKYEGLNKKKTK